jgi:hypothetical protein
LPQHRRTVMPDPMPKEKWKSDGEDALLFGCV